MPVKVYRHPETLDLKQVDPTNDVQVAAVKKLGYKEITGKDIEDEEKLGVTYEQVTRADQPQEPPALPKLTKPIPPGPTHDPDQPPPAKGIVSREGVEGPKDK